MKKFMMNVKKVMMKGNFELGYLHVDKIQNKKWHYFDNLIKFHESQRIK